MKLSENNSLNKNTQLSANFYLNEFTTSQVAERFGYRNQPNEIQIKNITALTLNLMQPISDLIDVPVFILSGFRCFDVNYAVCGRVNSQHLEGKAADFIARGLDLHKLFQLIQAQFQFDQLIYEFGKWIHASWNGVKNRNEVFISKKVFGVTEYEKIS